MSEEIKNNIFEMINAHKELIKINKHKIPNIYSDQILDNDESYGCYEDMIKN